MYRYDAKLAREAALSFGWMLRMWRRQNSWSQYTGYHWAKQVGFGAIAPSMVSDLENGKTSKPRPETFFALAEMNRRLAVGEYGIIWNHELGTLVRGSEPLRGDDGKVWAPVDFWCCHVGLSEVPRRYAGHSAQDLSSA